MEVTSGCEAGDCAAHVRRQTKQRPMDGHVRCCQSRFDRPSLLFGPGKLTFGSNFRFRGLGEAELGSIAFVTRLVEAPVGQAFGFAQSRRLTV